MVHSKKTLRNGFTNSFCNINGKVQSGRTESWEEKEVREKCWRAVTSLGGNFPEMWDFQTQKHRVSPQILAREREKNIQKVSCRIS